MQSQYNPSRESEISVTEDADCNSGANYQLLLWNDDVNSFDWVIKALIDICDHSTEQAEQCALLVHYKGKYPVSHGTSERLQPLCASFLHRNIGASIEQKS